MSLLDRMERFNRRLEARLDKKKNLEAHTERLQAQVESVEDLLNSNAVLAVPPDLLEDTISVIRKGLTVTDDVDPVVVALMARWCNNMEAEFLQGDP